MILNNVFNLYISGLMYSEITNIHNFIAARGIIIWLSKGHFIDENLIPVVLKINGITYAVHVPDEYENLNYHNPILNFIIVFRALSIINDSEDFLVWCKQEGLNPSNHKLLDYYKGICKVIGNINNCFPNNEIDYFVSDLDFQLNSGVMQFLRQ